MIQPLICNKALANVTPCGVRQQFERLQAANRLSAFLKWWVQEDVLALRRLSTVDPSVNPKTTWKANSEGLSQPSAEGMPMSVAEGHDETLCAVIMGCCCSQARHGMAIMETLRL